MATNLVQVYKALGGGWEIRNKRDPVDLLPAAMKEEMKEGGDERANRGLGQHLQLISDNYK